MNGIDSLGGLNGSGSDVMWQMFALTGGAGYYMLYKNLLDDENDINLE